MPDLTCTHCGREIEVNWVPGITSEADSFAAADRYGEARYRHTDYGEHDKFDPDADHNAEPDVSEEPKASPGLTPRELGTVLAALRLWQRLNGPPADDLMDIATDGGTLTPLDDDEIDALCERLNGGEPAEGPVTMTVLPESHFEPRLSVVVWDEGCANDIGLVVTAPARMERQAAQQSVADAIAGESVTSDEWTYDGVADRLTASGWRRLDYVVVKA